MRRLLRLLLVCALAAAGGCAHQVGLGSGKLSRSAERFAADGAAIKTVAFEEDYLDARLVYQALPLGSKPRAALRSKLLAYLVGPVATIDVEAARKDTTYFGDDVDQVLDAFKEALELFAAPELWTREGLRLSSDEHAQLAAAARVVVALFSPRGNEQAVATGLYVLATLEPGDRAWRERLDQLFGWLDTGAELALGPGGSRGNLPTVDEVLDSLANAWPTPAVVSRVTTMALERQNRLSSTLRRPFGTGASRAAVSELLLDGQVVQQMGVTLTALHLRCGQIKGAAEALGRLAGKAGDDVDLRQLLAAAARSGASPEAYLALARRFLPRLELLGGTSNDRLDPAAAAEVIRQGIDRHPNDTTLLVLGSRVARLAPAPFLGIRYLEEAEAALERSRASDEVNANVAAELLDLSFSRLRFLAEDPQHIEPAAREAESLRRRFAESRRRFGNDHFKLRDVDIDFALARGLVDAGLVDRAEPLLVRAHKEAEASVEVTLQIAKLLTKRGDANRAVQILREALENHRRRAPAEETIGFVEAQAKLARALGDAFEVAGGIEDARKAWKLAAQAWERLMVEQLRRKNLDSSAEATFEVGRLYYLLGRRADGIQKFNEAIEQNESRGQTYIDELAFLVQQGETEPALEIYRRVINRPGRSVNEYFKVYSSLWVIDLTRRSSKVADPTAEAYLRSLESRKVRLRPRRDADWYVPLARYALGRLSYDQLQALASTPGRRAELYFYEAMRRLAEGHSDDAHALWNKVIETKMVSFFEFEMAARYLRTGAPSQPRAESAGGQTI